MKIRGTGGGGRWGKKDQTGMNRGCLEGRNYSGKVEVFSSFALIFFLPLSLPFFSLLLLLLLLSSFSLCYYIILFLPCLVLPTLHLFIFLCHSLPPYPDPNPFDFLIFFFLCSSIFSSSSGHKRGAELCLLDAISG